MDFVSVDIQICRTNFAVTFESAAMTASRKKQPVQPRQVRTDPTYRTTLRERVVHRSQATTSPSTGLGSVSRAHTGLFFESAAVRSWYSGSNVLPALNPGQLSIDVSLTPPQVPVERSSSSGSPPSNFASVEGSTNDIFTPPKQHRPHSNVYNDTELLQMDTDVAFLIPSPDRTAEIFTEAVSSMATAWEKNLPCCVCERNFARSEIEQKPLTDEFIKLMHQSLVVDPRVEIPEFVIKQYDVSSVDSRLKGLLLYPAAMCLDGDTMCMNTCISCREHIYSRKCVPPSNAIANGNYIGRLPAEFKAVTRTEEQAVSLTLPCVSLSIVTGGSCKTIKSHHYVVQNTEGPIAEMLPRDITARIRVTMVGSMTSAQVAACKKKYELDLPLCRRLLSFFDRENREYKRRAGSISQAATTPNNAIPTSVILDRTASANEAPDDDDLVTSIRDESTYSSFGSTVQEGQDETIEDTWIGASSLLLQPQQQNWADVLVRKSNVYEPMSKWGVCVTMFPTLFPGGCGGPNECRLSRISVRSWILRCLQLHGHHFENHHAFMLLAFDYLASENARRTLYVKMNIKRQALKAAEIPRATVREAIQYFNHMNVCRSRGIKPAPPSLDVQRVIDLRKGLYVPESAFYGSNNGRMRARHDLFGLLKRYGPLQLFFTVSPDSAGTYSIAIKSGRVTEDLISRANVALLPQRAERKAIAALHPVECARYYLRVMKTVVDVLLGWDSSAHAPKRGGGIFGVVRAFGAATETQRAGDLHAHIAVWLHGFPQTVEAYNNRMESDSSFRNRFLQLANSVLSTKPPCIMEEQQCPICLTDDSLQPITPGVDAFRRPAVGASPPPTSRCRQCEHVFRDKDIMELCLQAVAAEEHVHVDNESTDFEKCRPPQAVNGRLATSLLVRDVQTHFWNHCRSCFKSTIRTPKASVCRFFKPEEVQLDSSAIEDDGKLRIHRAIGCEYVNAYNPVVMGTLKCNHDAQFVISSGAKHTAAYVVKYCCKSQNAVENYAALSLAAFAKATKKANSLPPETSAMERGYRILGSMLYTVTNGQEVAATMAALYVLHETPFWFSHDFVHINLKLLLQAQVDSVEVTVSQECSPDDHPDLARVRTDNALEHYWKREKKLEGVSFIDICEQYDYSGKSAVPATTSGSRLESVAFSKRSYRKVMVLSGQEIPDIASSLDQTQIDYYSGCRK